jgi:hypothetical protein
LKYDSYRARSAAKRLRVDGARHVSAAAKADSRRRSSNEDFPGKRDHLFASGESN